MREVGLGLWQVCGVHPGRCEIRDCEERWISVECDPLHGSHEAIAAAGQGLNESRIAGRISEGFADAIDRGVDAVLVIDKSAVGP